jgi:hypothetical protein
MAVSALLRDQYGVIGGDLTYEMPMVEMTLDAGYVRMLSLVRSAAMKTVIDHIDIDNREAKADTNDVEMTDVSRAVSRKPPSEQTIAARARRTDTAMTSAAARMSSSVVRISKGPGANKRKRAPKTRK